MYHLEGSTAAFTATQINDPFAPPDWYPNEHPPMPETVAHGRKPDLRACGQCHLPHGLGHPESSGIAGLPADYIVEQMRACTRWTPQELGRQLDHDRVVEGGDRRGDADRRGVLRIAEAEAVAQDRRDGHGADDVCRRRQHAVRDDRTGRKSRSASALSSCPRMRRSRSSRDGHSGFVAYAFRRAASPKGEELAMTGGDHVADGKDRQREDRRRAACATVRS